jgi:hypothetical protein
MTSETMPLASASARKPSMIPSGGRGVSIIWMRSRGILPVSFFSAIVALHSSYFCIRWFRLVPSSSRIDKSMILFALIDPSFLSM